MLLEGDIYENRINEQIPIVDYLSNKKSSFIQTILQMNPFEFTSFVAVRGERNMQEPSPLASIPVQMLVN